ncbi:hypothetical protein GGR56DRAFT_293909 [Xylariaceae sp. FL0804]|nr:hypothetical protein GGR56DRAFT_293909 [Xylariaceae sp. FL0804]
MSLPPQLIRVKRKASEDAPVSYLRVQEVKRHRSEAFVYRRQDEEAAYHNSIPARTERPIIHASQPGRSTSAFHSPPGSSAAANNDDTPETSASAGTTAAAVTSASTAEPRRFHMSRRDMMLAPLPYPSHGRAGVSKKRSAPALFVERRIKKISSRAVEKLHAAPSISRPVPQHASVAQEMDIDKPEPRRFKKPGVAKLANKDSTSKYKAELPKAMTQRWNVDDMDRLAAEMDAYALEQIGLNIQRVEEEKKKEAASSKMKQPRTLKIKPRAPAKRYAERHPNDAPATEDQDMEEADIGMSDSDDDGYVIETYVRVPASKLGDQVPPQSVGLLVFDADPDIEYFYGEGEDSEDEWAEDEEDENAENHYTADYPDDEVASDDEYNRNAYSYRNGNASDLEEYGLDGDSDDPQDGQDGSGHFKTHIGPNGFRSNHL